MFEECVVETVGCWESKVKAHSVSAAKLRCRVVRERGRRVWGLAETEVFCEAGSALGEGSGAKPYLPDHDARTANSTCWLCVNDYLLQHFHSDNASNLVHCKTLCSRKAGDEVLEKETSRNRDVSSLYGTITVSQHQKVLITHFDIKVGDGLRVDAGLDAADALLKQTVEPETANHSHRAISSLPILQISHKKVLKAGLYSDTFFRDDITPVLLTSAVPGHILVLCFLARRRPFECIFPSHFPAAEEVHPSSLRPSSSTRICKSVEACSSAKNAIQIRPDYSLPWLLTRLTWSNALIVLEITLELVLGFEERPQKAAFRDPKSKHICRMLLFEKHLEGVAPGRTLER
ncbi:uncharacterized protein MYCFIDRAFT_170333 [Pseudocercospora fijiensis CIRAD86]|uniref:Uncharacterized protein n=1 Tax=Pseudocercospora fijiensis (strain CIRAD86) TaxID=383855 RepID=N1QBX4_PSEFD|nr:uncharacterized protein MYCFIDRAFT_170333 [Pseudocercospora fijiensis CIRAD86]EME88748.1 hypothetical protein MYCFIDRAFT_170333 [Pseudocercospora fijiensis CIRAD86]